MGKDPPAPTPQESTAAMIQAYTQGLPGLMSVYNKQLAPNEQAQLEASRQVSPGYAALQNEIYKLYGPDAARTTLDIAKIQDPEYYKVREQAANKLINLINNPVSETERAEIERYVNRGNVATGNSVNPSATNTITNAMYFGDKARQNLSQALDQAINATPLLNSNKQTFTESRTAGNKEGIGNQTAGQSGSLLGNIGQATSASIAANANKRSGWDKTLGFLGSNLKFGF